MEDEKLMSDLRFNVGSIVLCNLGPRGWQLGKVIALHYREDHWPTEITAPYQVLLDTDHTLIYVPEDDERYCRKPSDEDMRIAKRIDALAELPFHTDIMKSKLDDDSKLEVEISMTTDLKCTDSNTSNYRNGHCYCCNSCPQKWSFVELYSEHYRCALRNNLKITRQTIDLGTLHVGDTLNLLASEIDLINEGFLQCPTLVRLPPGVQFSDDGSLTGKIHFDPFRATAYKVDFVAVSTVHWKDEAIGIFRLKISFSIEGNDPPKEFDMSMFTHEQEFARLEANTILHTLCSTWEMWERQEFGNRDTCNRMCNELDRLRSLLEIHPRLDDGLWWAYLGGFYMNVHKLLENTLFECELYLGYALTFGEQEIRQMAEQNLEGCYQKRLLEAARFMWIDGVEAMMRGEWTNAIETLSLAASKKDGWGWAVNYGDIWMSESAARLIYGATLAMGGDIDKIESEKYFAKANILIDQCALRANESGEFGNDGHPWVKEIREALVTYNSLLNRNNDIFEWLEQFKLRTFYWCALILGGAEPFPPKPRARLKERKIKINNIYD